VKGRGGACKVPLVQAAWVSIWRRAGLARRCMHGRRSASSGVWWQAGDVMFDWFAFTNLLAGRDSPRRCLHAQGMELECFLVLDIFTDERGFCGWLGTWATLWVE
jgi:hypothetical protein